MSMIGCYRRVTTDELSQLIAGLPIVEFLYPRNNQENIGQRQLDIDKAWHAIHFLLNDSAWGGEDPLVLAVMGGENVSDEDVGYGPARYLTPEQVTTVAAALGEIPRWELLTKYDAERMNEEEIYPDWDDSPENQDYIGEHYESLVTFFQDAARAGDAMLIYVS